MTMTLTPLDKNQLRALDATALLIGLTTEQLMERAGLELARFIEERTPKNHSILFLCGPGNNGGDGIVACRHLINKGYQASILLSKKQLSPAATHNLKILKHMNTPIYEWGPSFSFTPYDVLIDCLLGYNQSAPPRGNIADIIIKARKNNKQVYACDIPTGINATTGETYEPHLPARATLSLAAPKKAFTNHQARNACGDITITGIGIPAIVYEQLGLRRGEYLVEGNITYQEDTSPSQQ